MRATLPHHRVVMMMAMTLQVKERKKRATKGAVWRTAIEDPIHLNQRMMRKKKKKNMIGKTSS